MSQHTYIPFYTEVDGLIFSGDSPINAGHTPSKLVMCYRHFADTETAYIAWVLYKVCVNPKALDELSRVITTMNESTEIKYLAQPTGICEPNVLYNHFGSPESLAKLIKFYKSFRPEKWCNYTDAWEVWCALDNE